MKSKSQIDLIRNHLNCGNPITSLEALEMFGCFRLAAIIHSLKKQGMAIESKTVTTRNNKKIAEYRAVSPLMENQYKLFGG